MYIVTKTIPELSFFEMRADQPEAMDKAYPFFHNVILNNRTSGAGLDPDDPEELVIHVFGAANCMEPLENAIQYGGLVGRGFCSRTPFLAKPLKRIRIYDFVKHGGVKDADPNDGILTVRWPDKTLRYYDENGKLQITEADVEMSFIDLERVDELYKLDVDTASKLAYALFEVFIDEVKDDGIRTMLMETAKRVDMPEEEFRKESLSVWSKIMDIPANEEIKMDIKGV